MPAILAFGLNLDLLSLRDRPSLDEGRSAKLPIRESVSIAASAPANTVQVHFGDWQGAAGTLYGL